MLDKKSPDHSATLPTRVVRQSPDVAHVGIEVRQLLFDGGYAGRILQYHAASLEPLSTSRRWPNAACSSWRRRTPAKRLFFGGFERLFAG